MKKYFNLIVVIAFVITIASCNKDKYEAPKSNTVNMAGRWWIQLLYDDNKDGIFNEDDGDEIIYPFEDGDRLVTSNTAANTADTVWVDDIDETWPFKIKAPINYGALTFSPATVPNTYIEDGTVNIISGKILKAAAHTKSGAVADSIFIEFEFSDDEGSYYIYSGHRDTGQPEDQF